jgi:hypothetical protein
VRAGCDAGLQTKAGETGREVAEAHGHTAVVARLRACAEALVRADAVLAQDKRGPGHPRALSVITRTFYSETQ